ncbi:caspase family protein [Spirulina sp. CS-785/01]|uniref:caspase family protein n=1 Tax=Spirulina sp. CS-785/01 TaxID=3021716 RepID=UPI00232C4D6A|nr:caspase family protein [Spirulina sp. CS-785/01]MDB9313225.1 caspase family protein [Spirulina sp. CS-785/01]
MLLVLGSLFPPISSISPISPISQLPTPNSQLPTLKNESLDPKPDTLIADVTSTIGMGLDRRTFLQQMALALLSGGAGNFLAGARGNSLLGRQATRYGTALAAPAPRKLALLVGINQYSSGSRLKGCVTDVELQRELLLHRFQFREEDIVTLTNQQATREAIETTFVEHLLQQSEAGDVVVFHFSGFGSQVQGTEQTAAQRQATSEQEEALSSSKGSLMASLVPYDGMIPTKREPVANDLLAETLILLARSLPTRNCTFILDTSFAPIEDPLQGNLRSRSCPETARKKPSPEELAFQEQLPVRYKLNLPTPPPQWSQVPGLVLGAAQENGVALEQQWRGFSAGMFTYALTQYLWQAMPSNTVYLSLTRASEQMRPMSKQQPCLISSLTSQQSSAQMYFTTPITTTGAEGVITALDEKNGTVTLHLGGIPAKVWRAYKANSRFMVLTGEERLTLRLRSLDQLSGKAQWVESDPTILPEVGQRVQETVRILPRNLGLVVALDEKLQRIERVDATSALSNISAVSSIISAGEQQADYLFTKGPGKKAKSSGHSGGSHYSLSSVGGMLLPHTRGAVDEAVKSAVNRLIPTLKTRLAAKMWELTENEGSSRLPVRITLGIRQPKPYTLMERWTRGFEQQNRPNKQSLERSTSPDLVKIPVGSQLQYEIENQSDETLYVLLVGLDPVGNAIALYNTPVTRETEEGEEKTLQNTQLAPQTTLTLPQSTSSLNGFIAGSIGICTMQVICSQAPFKETLQQLAQLSSPKGEGDRLVELTQPLNIAKSLLQDLHQGSGLDAETIGFASEDYALDVNKWATFSLVFEVV